MVLRAALKRKISLLDRPSEGPAGIFEGEKILYNLRRVLYSASRAAGDNALWHALIVTPLPSGS